MSAAVQVSAALYALWMAATPAPTQVQAHASVSETKLGVPFTYEVVLTHPASQRYELQTLPATGVFEIAGQGRDRQDHGQDATTTFRIQMALFELGPQPLPALTFEVTEGGTRTPWTAPSGGSVTGLSSLPPDAQEKGAQLEDIKPPADSAPAARCADFGRARTSEVRRVAESRQVSRVPLSAVRDFPRLSRRAIQTRCT